MLTGMLCNGLINSGSLGQFHRQLKKCTDRQFRLQLFPSTQWLVSLARSLLGWLNDRFGVVVSTVCGCVAFAVSFIFMLMGSNVTMLYIMAVLFGLGDAIGTVTPPLAYSAVFGTKKYGQAYGICKQLYSSWSDMRFSYGLLRFMTEQEHTQVPGFFCLS